MNPSTEALLNLLTDYNRPPQEEPEAPRGSIGEVLAGRFRLVRLLGQGGFGEVWEATDGLGGPAVAVKINRRPEALARFGLEIDTLARMSHPGIVQLIDEGFDRPSGRRFLVMEIVRGRPLSGHGISTRALLSSFVGLLEVLAFTHARGIIHRDLKPDNVLVAPNGVKVLDFGVARWRGTFQGTKGRGDVTGTIGTPAYMSPEQASGEAASVGPASDLYTVGVMLYEMLAGRRPFYGSWLALMASHCRTPPPPLPPMAGIPPEVQDRLSTLVDGLLEKRYSHRIERAADALAELHQIIARLPEETAHASHPPPASSLDDHTMDTGDESAEPPAVHTQPAALPALAGTWRLTFLRELLLGRQSELALLTARAETAVSQGTPRGLCVHGPAGSGKRRLVETLAQTAHANGSMRVLRLRLGAQSDLMVALHDGLSRHLRYPRLELRPLRRCVDESFALNDADADALTHFLLRRPGDSPETYARWGTTLYRVLANTTTHPSRRGLLVWIDAAQESPSKLAKHWLDGLLTAPSLSATPMLTVWTTEHPSPSPWEPLPLEALQPDVMRQLANALAPKLNPAGAEFAANASGGNPRFLRELLWSWHSDKAFVPGEGGQALGREAIEGVPKTLSALYRDRVESFFTALPSPTDARRALCGLALMSHSFTPRQAAWALEDCGVTEASLLGAGWLAHGEGRQEELRFDQQGLKAALIDLAARAPDAMSLLLDAVSWRMRGALRALCHSDWERGLRNLQDARAIIERHRLDAPELNTAIAEARARIRYRQRDRVAVVQEAEALALSAKASALPDGVRTRREAQSLLWQGAAALLGHDYETAADCAAGALGLFGACGDRHGQALASQYAAHAHLHQRALAKADEQLDMALGFARRHRLETTDPFQSELAQLTEADITRDLAERAASHGQHTRAMTLLEEAMGLHEAVDDLQGQAYTCIQLTRVSRLIVEASPHRTEALERALHWMAKARSLMGSLDDRRGHALVAWEGALLAMVEGNSTDADGLFEAASHLFEADGDGFSAALCLSGRAENAQKAERLDDALDLYRAFTSRMEALQSPGAAAMGALSIAWIHLDRQSADEAQAHFEQALAVFAPESQPQDCAAVQIGLAAVAVLRGQPPKAHLDAARDHLDGAALEDEPARQALLRLRATTPPHTAALIDALLALS